MLAIVPQLMKPLLNVCGNSYMAGSHWHTRLRTEQNHFIYSDLPRCIMDSYEDCGDPPRLHKLDKYECLLMSHYNFIRLIGALCFMVDFQI